MTSRITLPSIHCLLHATGLETNHHGYLPDLPPLSLHHDMPPRVPQQQHQQQHNDAYPSPPSTTHVGPLFTRPAIPKPEETVIPPQRRRASSFFSYNNEHIAVAFCTSSFPKQQHTDVSLTEATNAETQDDDETRDSDDSLLRRPSAQLSLTHHPRRKSSSASSSSCLDETKRDIADHVRQMQWHRTINLSDDLWEETCRHYLQIRQMKEMKNRHPNRKCKHILVSILYVLCRKHNDPRTFAEICTAANVRKQEIGAYYRLVLKLLKTSTVGLRTVNIEECLQRWCSTMELPPLILPAAICVSRRAAELNLTQGKCAISLGAASIYLCCQTWSHVRIQKNCPINPLYDIWQSHKEIAMTAGVVTATLIGCYRLLRPHVHTLLPDWFLVAAASDLSQDPATRPVSK